MADTRQSLLLRAQTGDEGAWKDLAVLYRPLIVSWLRHQAVPPDEVDDLVQDILLSVVQSLPSFCHSGRVGAFRSWMRTIARNCACDFWKGRGRQAVASGGSGASDVLRHLADPDSDLNRNWEPEPDPHPLPLLLALVELQFAHGPV